MNGAALPSEASAFKGFNGTRRVRPARASHWIACDPGALLIKFLAGEPASRAIAR